MGLGLSICQKITEFMDGGISVESKENEGSTFTFSVALEKTKIVNLSRSVCAFPASSKVKRVNESSTLEMINPFASEKLCKSVIVPTKEKLRVLIVEDYHFNFMAMQLMLEQIGSSM